MSKPTLPEVLPLVRALYKEHPTGCCLHNVLDDGNVRDSHVQFCHEIAVERDHIECVTLASLLLRMSKTQRLKLGGE